jgi:hypothetical protein
MRRSLVVLAVTTMAAVFPLAQCNSAPPPPPVHPVIATPSATVSAPVASVEAPPPAPPPKPRPPEPPAPQLVSAGAFLVWIEDSSATGGFRTALVEPAGQSPKMVAQRPEVVLASSKELWVLRTKKTKVTNCADCDACMRDSSKCKKTATASVDEPLLQSLGTGRTIEPWSKSFTFESGCTAQVATQDATVTPAGAVGTVLFADWSKSTTRCGGDEADDGASFAYDLDKEAMVELTLPDPPTETLSAKAKADLIVQGCAGGHTEDPTFYRARAAYGDDGVLRGLYGFSMAAQQGCANGPDHSTALSEQKSPWIPPELAAYGKLPAYVTGFMADRSAVNAMPIAAARVADAEKEMARTDKDLDNLAKAFKKANPAP